jgi:hypothetical protein
MRAHSPAPPHRGVVRVHGPSPARSVSGAPRGPVAARRRMMCCACERRRLLARTGCGCGPHHPTQPCARSLTRARAAPPPPRAQPLCSLTDPSPARRAAASAMLCFAREAGARGLAVMEAGSSSGGSEGEEEGASEGDAIMGPPALPKGGMTTVRRRARAVPARACGV